MSQEQFKKRLENLSREEIIEIAAEALNTLQILMDRFKKEGKQGYLTQILRDNAFKKYGKTDS